MSLWKIRNMVETEKHVKAIIKKKRNIHTYKHKGSITGMTSRFSQILSVALSVWVHLITVWFSLPPVGAPPLTFGTWVTCARHSQKRLLKWVGFCFHQWGISSFLILLNYYYYYYLILVYLTTYNSNNFWKIFRLI